MKKHEYLEKIKKEFSQITFNNTKFISHGWDNDVVILDNKWVFRFPKRKEYRKRFRAELIVLEYLKGRVNIPIPEYNFISNDKTFGGYKILKGQELRPYLLKQLPLQKRQAIAKQLGIFLSIIHSMPVKVAENAGFNNPKEGHWYSQKAVANRFSKIKRVLFPKLSKKEVAWITQEFDNYIHSNTQPLHSVVHGDFVPDHILFDQNKGNVSGIIDFSDIEVGDPELEFGGLWCYGSTFVKEAAEAHSPVPPPEALEKSKFPMKTHMVWSMYELLTGIDIPVTFDSCRKELHQVMKRYPHRL